MKSEITEVVSDFAIYNCQNNAKKQQNMQIILTANPNFCKINVFGLDVILLENKNHLNWGKKQC